MPVYMLIYFIVDGSSDDLDEPIKEVFLDRKFVDEHHLCSINSINWARILVQVIYRIVQLELRLKEYLEIINMFHFWFFRWRIMHTFTSEMQYWRESLL